jgi:hypothetical protein
MYGEAKQRALAKANLLEVEVDVSMVTPAVYYCISITIQPREERECLLFDWRSDIIEDLSGMRYLPYNIVKYYLTLSRICQVCNTCLIASTNARGARGMDSLRDICIIQVSYSAVSICFLNDRKPLKSLNYITLDNLDVPTGPVPADDANPQSSLIHWTSSNHRT